MADTSTSRTNSGSEEDSRNDNDVPEKKSKAKQLWEKIGLDAGTVVMMFKGSLPPTIGIAIYQADSVANYFSTLGYLVGIISVLSLCIMPRAKYLQTLILNVIGICIGSAVALLGIWSGVQARNHTQGPVAAAYNSSQSAVCAIWLFANIYFVNVMRAKIPALQFPVIMYSIFTNVAFTYGPLFTTIEQGESLIKRLLVGFLAAFGISTGVSLFIFPVTSRTVVFKEMEGYFGLLRGTLKAQTAYVQSLETSDMFAGKSAAESGATGMKIKKNHPDSGLPTTSKFEPSPESKALKGAIDKLTGLHGKLHGDIPFGKREPAWGKLKPSDFDEIYKLFQGILIPLIGMSTITDIFERVAERRGWLKDDGESSELSDDTEYQESARDKAETKRLWNEIMKQLHEPFAIATEAMDEGLLHAGLLLEILPKPKAKKGTKKNAGTADETDVEAKAGGINPGDAGYAAQLRSRMTDFYKGRGETLRTWAREKGLSVEQFDASNLNPDDLEEGSDAEAAHRRDQQQLYLILYMEHLLFSTGMAIDKLVEYAEKKAENGQMKNNRLILPGRRRLKKWILSLGKQDSSVSEDTPDSAESGQHNIYLGAGFNQKKDPEHLPPTTVWQHVGNGIREIPHFFGSIESAFGFRVACATLTIGIVAFLEDTYQFFIEQRLVWAMIIIAIGMGVTSGQSIFGFFGRVMGTALAMVFSFVIWYIVDQKTPGILVFLWFFIFLEMYGFLKYPRFIPVFLVCIVTQVLIIGYELQVRKIGVAASEASGQPAYPIYELAPYRLACVAGGSFVAFIWTIWPYPLSDKSWMRKDLGSTIYLLANFYSVVHSTIGARLHRAEGDMDDKQSPGRQLEKVRRKIFGKLLLLLPSLQQHADWQKWEVNIGGKFPRETYEAITHRLTNIMHYMTLMVYATQTWQEDFPNTNPEKRRVWLDDVARLLDSVDPTSHAITSVLTLLGASVTNGNSLPPYIQLPEPYQLSRKLEKLDRGILDSRHIEEPGYSAYAVLQITSSLISDDIRKLVGNVKDLVGETDFSFSVNDRSLESVASSGTGKNKVA